MTYPHVRISGSARDRGRQYGLAASDRIRRSVRGYEKAFRAAADLDWGTVRAETRRYVPPIEDLGGGIIEEIKGLAEGAGVDVEDILALNVRTEILARAWAASPKGPHPADGCTAIALTPTATADGHTVVAQNWDWLVHSLGTVIVLEVEPDTGPAFVTVVEAGLLAKAGMNAAGLGLATNFLLSADDDGRAGVPYHIVLRSLLGAETLSEGLNLLQQLDRSSSANYLLAHADGLALDVETRPGGFEGLSFVEPSDGVIVHANHYEAQPPEPDISRRSMVSSVVRRMAAEARIRGAEKGLSLHDVEAVLSDHANFPASVCYHADPRVAEAERDVTAASVVMDLTTRTLRLADGNPCAAGYRTLEYGDGILTPVRSVGQSEAPGLAASTG